MPSSGAAHVICPLVVALNFLRMRGFSQSIDVLNTLEGRCHSIALPIKVKDIHMLTRRAWLLTDSDADKKYMLSESSDRAMEYTLEPVEENWTASFSAGQYWFRCASVTRCAREASRRRSAH